MKGSLREKEETLRPLVGQTVCLTTSYPVLASRLLRYYELTGELLVVTDSYLSMTTEFGEKTFHLGNLVGVRDAAGNVIGNWATRGELPAPSPLESFTWQRIKHNWTSVSVRDLRRFVVLALAFDSAALLLPTASLSFFLQSCAVGYTGLTIGMLLLNGPRLWRER